MNPYDPPNTPVIRHVIQCSVIYILGTCVVFLVFIIAPFAWILRDGLGPGSTTSVGWNSILRMFWTFNWGPVTLGTLLLLGTARFFSKSRITHE
jgi:hypothetical protein